MALKGTLINTVAILAGTLIGLLVGNRYPEKMKQTVMSGLGLVTSIIGIKMALQSENILFPLAGIALGGITGELLDLDLWINRLGDSLEKMFTKAGRGSSGNSASAPTQGSFARGFVAATLLFCIGPMAIIGGIQDGLTGDFSTLAAKATIDGFTSIAFASSLGPGVAFSALPVFIYQGAISLGAGFFNRILSAEMILEMTSAGGLLLFAIGLGLLEVKKIRVANLLPAIFLTPAICYIAALIGM
jgi:uncharacterized membrane protein YqgA involved in biofilm formation